MPRLSIVIPVLDSPTSLTRLEDTLVSVLENRPDDCQIVVVLSRPYNDPYDLKDEVCFLDAPAGAGLASCVNLGIRASESPIVHLLACGVEVRAGWADEALARFDDPMVAGVSAVVLDRRSQAEVLSAGIEYRASGFGRRLVSVASSCERTGTLVAPDISAAFYRTTAVEAVGLLAEDVGERCAGIDLALRLQAAGFRFAREPRCRVCADRAPVGHEGPLRRGLCAERLFWRWAPHFGWPRSLAGHMMLLAVECLQCPIRPSKLLELAGRVAGALDLAAHRRHWETVRHLGQRTRGVVGAPHFAMAPRTIAPSRVFSSKSRADL